MSNTVILIYLILTLSIGYAFIYPAASGLNALMNERNKQEDVLNMVGRIEAKKKALQDKFNEIPEENRQKIETFLPSSMDFVKLANQINAVSSKYGFSVKNFTSQESSSSDGSSIGENAQSFYQKVNISISFDASYDQFNEFMNDLGKSLRILDVKSVKIRTQKGDIYSYIIEFDIYWLRK